MTLKPASRPAPGARRDARDCCEAVPRVSFLLLAFQQERTVEAAMRAALAQTFAPLEIIVSDDASTDGTFDIIRRIAAGYRGPHHLAIRRNTSNLGLGGHLDRVLRLASGDLLILAAGDDISAPERAERTARCFRRHPDTGIAYAQLDLIDRDDTSLGRHAFFFDERRLNDLDSYLSHDAVVPGAGFAIDRALVDRFGPIGDWNEVEDRFLIFRCLLLGRRLRLIDEPLVRWRRSGRSADTRRSYACPRKDRLQDYAWTETHTRWMLGSFRQNLADLAACTLPAADRRIARLLTARIAEAELLEACWRSDRVSAARLRAALAAGARPARAIRHFAKFRWSAPYLGLIEPWRALRRLLEPKITAGPRRRPLRLSSPPHHRPLGNDLR